MLGGVLHNHYNSYVILDSPRIRRERLMSGLILNIVLAFLVVVVSSLLLNVFQNYFLSKDSFGNPANLESAEEILNQGYMRAVDQCQYEKEPVIEMTRTNWVHKLLGIKTVYAAAAPLYQAKKLTSDCGSVNIIPNKSLTCQISFKNIGSRTWYNYGKNYVSLYADSLGKIFKYKDWSSPSQPAKLLEAKVLPGQIGHLKFALQVPEALGLYKTKFKLAAEDLTWIFGGVLEIPINVNLNNASASTQVTTTGESGINADLQALKLIQSHNSTISLNSGEKVIFRVGFKNNGQTTWQNTGDGAIKICVSPLDRQSTFRDSSWLDTNCPAVVSSLTAPGQMGYFSFVLQSFSAGDYEENFVLMSQGKVISGGEFSVPIKVSPSLSVPNLESENLGSEPNIRIGLYSTADTVVLRANGDFEVRDGNGNLVANVPSGISVYASFDFNTKKYALVFNGSSQSNLPYLKFVPQNSNVIFEITNYENRPSWNTILNDNKFRGALELRYSEERDKLYVINELPLEAYLKGVAESSNNNPIEYHKALVIAARTYAQYNINIGGKHPAAYFHLNASAYDQVYRGYNSEMRLPNFVRAVEETRGLVVTYNNEIVVTPYFSQSDGRTRSWEEVWAAPGKPWLVSKTDPYCAGMSLWGHGVGLSARGAHDMAQASSNFEQILKYYYTGTELKKIY